MGKKKSGSTSEAAKVSRDRNASAISNRDINKLHALGFISASEEDICLPGSVTRPKPPKGFTVMFAAFLFRGLSLPAHEFLRSLLFFYGIQLWQLTPNSILHLSIFITVCEAFLGIEPHWGLWRKIFYVKHHNDSNGPPVVGGVGFVVRKEVDYFDYPMKESVQGWRNKWFYLRDPAVSGRRSNLPPFDDVLVAHKKKSWNNALSPEEKATADELFKQIVTLKNGGMTMRDELQNEVRRLTCLSTKDTIVLTSARPPYDFKHLPSEVPAVAQYYPPSPESGVVHDDLIASAESSSTGGDNDADEAASPPPAKKGSTSFFVDEDDLDLSADDDDDVPLAKRAKLASERVASAKESNPSPAKSTPPSRTGVGKVPLSRVIPSDDAPTPPAGRDHPIYATVDAVADFAEQFTRLEAENAQLRKAIKSSADQAIEANRIAADAKSENALLKEEVTRLKRQMKDDQDARRAAAAAIDKKEGVLRESVKDLLEAANLTVSRRHQLREDSTADALSLAAESNVQILRLLQKSKGRIVASDAAEEDRKIHEEVEAMTDVAHPTHGLWLHRPKAVIMAKFKYRVMKAHYYFDKYYALLTMVWHTLFPLDQAPGTLSGLFTRFKSPERTRQLVRKELLAGAELAFASILACHPTLNLGAVANTERDLSQYYDVARGPAYTVVSRMESCLEKELKAHWDRGTRL
ncbi:hypothetical protein QYE76_001464 [Lolium multiflorum]|uniref:Transposase (putative) gypsy type domain-containing protein n=1 Tax=Lolium multiflorum TaxID=4521 RepID=A0AAD8RL93_LOLMU|nr:hypothetical protein QYE76_001464 [Lolium multiflorum]